jgi:hypothetical protein
VWNGQGDAAAMSRVSLLEYDDRFGVMYPDAFHKCVLPYRLMDAELDIIDWGAVLYYL